MRLNSICNRLSPRQMTILTGIVAGERMKETAQHLGISHRTVESHHVKIKRKLGARNLADLVRVALRGK